MRQSFDENNTWKLYSSLKIHPVNCRTFISNKYCYNIFGNAGIYPQEKARALRSNTREF